MLCLVQNSAAMVPLQLGRFAKFGCRNLAKLNRGGRSKFLNTSAISLSQKIDKNATVGVSNVRVCSPHDDKPCLEIVWEDNKLSHFPLFYLRDNCLCPSCFEKSAQQRLYNVAQADELNILADSVNFNPEKQIVTVNWHGGHNSQFDVKWLKERDFPKSKQEQIKNSQSFIPRKIPWTYGFKAPEFDFQTIISHDQSQYAWLMGLATHGLTLIKNAPIEPNALMKIADKVGGYIRQTHYGSIFKVRSKPDPSNIAYSGLETPLHVDLAYYDYQPCTQYLHCIKQTEDPEGGSNSFVDGFQVADYFRRNHPEVFHALTTMKFTFRDIGKDEYGDFEKKLERPVVTMDDHGFYKSIAHNNFTRSSFMNLPLADVCKLYEAYFMWTKKIREKESQITYKLKPGEIWAFDNMRILHSREKFDVMKSERYFEGMYLDWDEIYSALRVLRRKLNIVQGDSNSFD